MLRVNALFSSLFLIGIVVSTSCVQDSNPSTLPKEVEPAKTLEVAKPVEQTDPIPETSESVDVASYSEYPDEIDGCACYFGRTASQLGTGDYVFMTDYGKKGFMTLDGKMQEFQLISSKDLEGGMLMERWSNVDYQMVIKTTETGQVDETWQKVGTINIKPNDKDATMISIVGECGC